METDPLMLHPIRLQNLSTIDTESWSTAETLTLDWASSQEKQRVIRLAVQEHRQTMNLRTRPGARLMVLRRPEGGFAGWGGLDMTSDPEHPEVFSLFIYPPFRGSRLGGLLEHVAWAHLDRHGVPTVYTRIEAGRDDSPLEKRLASGYCREVFADELGPRFLAACRDCELFGSACRRQAFLAIDVAKANAACNRVRGPLDPTLPHVLKVEVAR